MLLDGQVPFPKCSKLVLSLSARKHHAALPMPQLRIALPYACCGPTSIARVRELLLICIYIYSLPEFMNFKLFGKTVVNKKFRLFLANQLGK